VNSHGKPAITTGSPFACEGPSFTVGHADHRLLGIARAIHGVQMLAYAQEAALLGVPTLPPQQRTVEQLQASNECFVAACLSSTLLGAVGVIDKPEVSILVINSLVVHPAHQRAGIATRLLLHALAASNAASVRVSTGAGNEPALALYRQHGFVEYKRWFVGAERLELVALKLERASARR
jgi:ribosomal protein S18 acetylase RimI-like enzyme